MYNSNNRDSLSPSAEYYSRKSPPKERDRVDGSSAYHSSSRGSGSEGHGGHGGHGGASRDGRSSRWDNRDRGYRRKSPKSNGRSGDRDRSRSPARRESSGKDGRDAVTKRAISNWSDSSDDEEETHFDRSKNGGDKVKNGASLRRQEVAGNPVSDRDERIGSNYVIPKFGVSSASDGVNLSNPYDGFGAVRARDQNTVPGQAEPGSGLKNSSIGIQIKMLPQSQKPTPVATAVTPTSRKPISSKIASVFNDDDDDEPEEMPAECKMRMKNVGRETPTSAGPNSFGKTKIGFCNTNQIKERLLQEKLLSKK